MVSFTSCAATVLALFASLLSALTIPLNGQNLCNPSNTSLSCLESPATLKFPPAPFHYEIPPDYQSQTSVIFTNYGPAISRDDAIRTLLEAQVMIMQEMARDPRIADLPVGRTRVFSSGTVTVTVEPQPQLNYAYLGLWLAGVMQAGETYGFVRCEMQYVDERPIFGPGGFILGTGRLGSS